MKTPCYFGSAFARQDVAGILHEMKICVSAPKKIHFCERRQVFVPSLFSRTIHLEYKSFPTNVPSNCAISSETLRFLSWLVFKYSVPFSIYTRLFTSSIIDW